MSKISGVRHVDKKTGEVWTMRNGVRCDDDLESLLRVIRNHSVPPRAGVDEREPIIKVCELRAEYDKKYYPKGRPAQRKKVVKKKVVHRERSWGYVCGDLVEINQGKGEGE